MAGFANRKTTNDDYKSPDTYYSKLIKMALDKKKDRSIDIFETPVYHARFLSHYNNPYIS